MTNVQYFISQLNFDSSGNWIDQVMVHQIKDSKLSRGVKKNRDWMVDVTKNGGVFYCIVPNNKGKWQIKNEFQFIEELYKWNMTLPNILPRRKVFISFHHGEKTDPDRGEIWKEKFEKLFDDHFDAIISKSVGDKDIQDGIKTETTRQIIRDEYIAEATVTVVLIGPDTWKRKHVDWEISSSIKKTKNNSRCGLIGIFLPTHPDYGKDKYKKRTIPPRLYDNVDNGYAKLYDWSENPHEIQQWIEEAFKRRDTEQIDNSYPMFAQNRKEDQTGWIPHK